MSLLILLGGFAVAIIVASATYRLLMRSRGVKAPSTALPRPDFGDLLFTEGQRPAAIVLSTIVGLGILSGFLYALYPDFFNAFRASRIFVPTYLGIIVVAVLRTRKQEGWRSLGSLVLLLLVGAGGREIWIRRPPSLPKQETVVQTAPPVEVYRELFVVAPKDGSWSPWIDTYGTGGVKWYKATRNDFVVGTEAGEAYSSSVTVPPGRVFRFRSTNGRESRIQVVGARLSYVQPGIVVEPSEVELTPTVDSSELVKLVREVSLIVAPGRNDTDRVWSDSINRGNFPASWFSEEVPNDSLEIRMRGVLSDFAVQPGTIPWRRIYGSYIQFRSLTDRSVKVRVRVCKEGLRDCPEF